MEKKIVRWIKNKVRQAKAKGAVFGLSGGIDSAVVAALVKKAVGNNHVALILPCQSSKSAIADAKRVARVLRLKSKMIILDSVYNSLVKVLPKGNNLAFANIKPRLRMIILYYFANSLNYLVLGTGNKSELSVGYFTKFGDGGVDILPIGDLLKSQIRILAEKLGVPEEIIKKPPSADLWHGQTDEAEIGLTYDELDLILSNLGLGKKIKLPKTKVDKVKRMVRFSHHKRQMPQICNL